VKIIENCHVEEILTEKQRAGQYDRVTSAVTSQGNIKCDVFINCTGMVSEFHLEKKIIRLSSSISSGHENLDFNHYQVFEFLHKLAVNIRTLKTKGLCRFSFRIYMFENQTNWKFTEQYPDCS
jgi:hypothetical protein